jgi:acetyl-CoA acyltransferase
VGHPWAATGGRVFTTLAYEMARGRARRGLGSIYAAGGMAGAFLLAWS